MCHLSLIVCTRNRANQLQLCLDYIEKITCRFSWELIVADNNSTDNTAEVVQAYIAKTHIDCRYILAVGAGNGAGRNEGISASRGEILVFTDDDCYVEPNYLDETAALYLDPEIGYTAGRIMLFDKTDYPMTINESMQPIPLAAGRLCRVGTIQGANMAFRRTALEEVGLFDPNFGAGARFAGEDWDLALRLSARGWSGGYFPGPVVFHHHGRKAADMPSLSRFYSKGEGAVYAKHLLMFTTFFGTLWLWAKSIYRDLSFKSGSWQHFSGVVVGAFQYWFARSRGQLLQHEVKL